MEGSADVQSRRRRMGCHEESPWEPMKVPYDKSAIKIHEGAMAGAGHGSPIEVPRKPMKNHEVQWKLPWAFKKKYE